MNFSLKENSVSSNHVTGSKTFVWFVHVLPASALILQVVPLLPKVWRHSWGNFRTFISMNPGWVSVCLNISWHRTLKCGISTGRIWIVFVFLGCLKPRTKSGPGRLRAFTGTLDDGCVVWKTVDSDGSVSVNVRRVGGFIDWSDLLNAHRCPSLWKTTPPKKSLHQQVTPIKWCQRFYLLLSSRWFIKFLLLLLLYCAPYSVSCISWEPLTRPLLLWVLFCVF